MATPVIQVRPVVFGELNTDPTQFVVWLSEPSATPITVNWFLGGQTANGLSDFTAAAGTLTFAAGVTELTIPFNIVNDATAEGTESFKLQLTGASANALVGDINTTGFIIDNDTSTATPRVSVSDLVIDEESREAWFVVSLDQAGTQAVTLNYTTQDGTALAGLDYVAKSDTLSFAAGETAKTVKVSLINDSLAELSESFNLVLSGLTGGATTLDTVGTATIHENDATRVANSAITVDDVVVGESETYAEFLVRLNTPNLATVTVIYQTVSETARNVDGDYIHDTGALTFAAGETVKTVRITLGGIGAETDDLGRIENFKLQLITPLPNNGNFTIARAEATATLIDNDIPSPTPRVSVGDFVVDEESREAWFVVSLDNAGTQPVTLNYATQNGTALAGSDYVATSGALSFAAGETAKTVKVSLINDALAELSESFNLVLSNLTGGATTLDTVGTATIHENDATRVANSSITVDDVVVGESETYAEFLVRLNAPNLGTVTVNYQNLNETARNIDGDYVADTGTLTFAAGETVKIVRITLGAVFAEANDLGRVENFKLQLLTPSANATIARAVGTATLIDNDIPSPTPRVSVGDFVVDEESREAWFVVSLDNAGTQPVTLNYATQNGTALAGSDYLATSGTLSFAVGETAKTVKVSLINDALAELSESFNLVLSGLTGGATTLDAVGTATIHENDATRVANSSITVDDVVVGESETYAEFLVRLNAPNLGTVTVNYQNLNETARNIDGDYVADTGTLTFAAGETVKIVRITLGAVFAEANDLGRVENFKLQLLTPSANATIARAVGTATLIDNDIPSPTPRVSVGDFVVDEESREAWFVVSLDNAGTQPVTLNYATQNGTALAGSDYLATSGTLSFAVGETAKTVKVSLINDALAELSESFNLVLSGLTGGATTLDTVGTATIHENDATRVANSSITVDDVVVGESETYAEFLVRLNAPNLGTVTVNYQNLNETARNIDGDYVADTGTLTFAAGETVKIVRITLGAVFAEANDLGRVENFKLQLLTPSANATIARAVGTATLIDNDIPSPTPRVSVGDFVVDEESREAWFVVSLDNAGTQPVTLNYATQNGTALAGSDYVATSGALSFAAGETAKTVKVSLINDALAELSESFNLVLSNLTGGATTLDAVGTATIHENDATRVASSAITVDDVVVGESETYAEFLVRLNAPNLGTVTVNYQNLNETARNIDGDYVADTGSLTFAAGETVKTVRISLGGLGLETVVDRTENFKLQLFTPSANATIARAVGTATIIDNDAPTPTPVLSIVDVVADENDSIVQLTVALDNAGTAAVTVDYALQGLTATGGTDYRPLSAGSIAFAPGETVKTILIGPLSDGITEGPELFDVMLSNAVGATLTDANAHVVIAGSDGAVVGNPSITVANAAAIEGSGYLDFLVALSSPSTTTISVNYNTVNGTGVAGSDYIATGSNTLRFAPGEMVKTVRVTLIDDIAIEATESFSLQLASPVNAVLGTGAAIGTILDNESALPAAFALAGTTGPDVLRGTPTADVLTGSTGDDVLIGAAGNDTMQGGTGNDTYVVEDATDVVTEAAAAAGTDTVLSSISYVLGVNLENLYLTGTDAINGTGNSADNTIVGNGAGNVLGGGAGNDTLIGGGGIDTLIGGTGNDTYIVDTTGDVVTENAAEGTDLVQSSATYTLSANVENLTLTGAAAINGTGNALANVLTGNAANNVLNGGAGADTMAGGLGNDSYIVDVTGDVVTENAAEGTDLVQSSATYTLSANLENLTLVGAAAINGTGNALNNVINGNAANNILNGGAGADTMTGGLGNDTYVVDNAGDLVTEAAAAGTDTVQSGISYVLGTELENLTLTGAAAINGIGNALANVLLGNGADNILDGGAGLDSLAGGLGNDSYIVDATGDVVTENAAEGTDLVQSSATYTLSANLENLTLTGAAAINGTGNTLANILTGNAANNVLNGGAGADTMTGGLGNDTYVVDNAGDLVSEAAAAGADTVQSGISYVLGANLENLTLIGAAAINGTGNALNNVINGNAANNILNGGAGADTMAGGLGNDTYVVDNAGDLVTEAAAAGTDTVQTSINYVLGVELENLTLIGAAAINGTGNALANTLLGNGADNILDGGAGIDSLAGGLGNDSYIVDATGDVVTENAAEGTDLVQSSATYTLSANLENLTLTGVAAINGIGNALNNVINGNAANNVLNGGAGADTMTGGLGNDSYLVDNAGDLVSEAAAAGTDTVQTTISYVLGANLENLTLIGAAAINGTGNALNNVITGNAANNVLNGGAGADTMAGGLGNDSYVVDNAGDLVTEAAAAGTDTVQSGISYILGAELENLTLTGAAAINGTGNALANVLLGNGADNILDGGAGLDSLAGGLGNDSYIVDATGDVVTENAAEGTDLVQSSATYTLSANLENLTLTGAAAINGIGNALANVLIGNAANNVLNGGAGADSMAGGLGNDTYVVDNAGDLVSEAAAAGADTVQSGISYVLGANLENLTLIGAAAINGTGNALNNVITGNTTANILNGGAGADTMTGGLGDDSYVVDNALDAIVELVGGGTDSVQSSVSYALAAEVENLTLIGAATTNGTGNALANSLTGNGANNVLDGGAGADSLAGGLGDDSYIVDNTLDVIAELAGGGTDSVQSSASYTLGAEIENLTLTGAAALNGTGNALANTLLGNGADNILDGGAGIDSLAGGLGNDSYIVDATGDVVTENAAEGTDLVQSSATYTLLANLENLTLTGVAAINGTGNTLANILTGNAANNVLNGGAGADTMTGGLGNDTYLVDNAGDLVTEAAAAGTDTVQSGISYVLGANLENLTLIGAATINGTGNALNNVITGNATANILNGGAGADTMAGGLGNDTYLVDNAGDLVTEAAAAGTDTVQTSISYVLGVELENLTLIGAAAINGTGNALTNVLTGNAANNILNGGAGADSLAGGLGDDSYIVDNTLDVIVELAGGGTDSVQSSASYTLGAEIENLTLTGAAAINGTGNALANVLLGNGADNILDGGAGLDSLAGGLGNDSYIVDATGDVVTENAAEGTDLVQSSATYTLSANIENLTLTGVAAINGTGNALANTLTGNAANNVLNGGAGADSMAGGLGNDTYVVDNAGDLVSEAVAAGTDTVRSGISYVLGANLENLTLTGVAAINGTGNALNNVITGNTSNNILDGGSGTDNLIGGAGNDVYIVDVATDVVNETAVGSDGIDRVETALASYALGTNVENLLYTGVATFAGTGNALANVITGGAGNDTLVGVDGNDTLNGNAGADTLDGGLGNDTLLGGDGNDSMLGGAGQDSFVGGAGNDSMDGGAIIDRINYTDLNSVSYSAAAAAVTVNLATGIAQDGQGGTDTLTNINFVTGSANNDLLTGSTALIFEQFDGGAGDDTIDGGAVTDTLNQDNNNRVTYQNAGSTVTVNLAAGTATGGGGNDILLNITQVRGSNFNDNLLGSDSALTEQFEGRAGNDTIDGRGGLDLARYDNAGAAVNVNLATGIASDGDGGTDTLLNIEGIRGSAFNDTLTGGNPANGSGALDGLERFMGNGGNDTIDGGTGFDRVEYRTSTVGVSVTLGGSGNGTAQDGLGGTDTLINIEAVRGSDFDDTLTGSDSAAFESFEGRAGSDVIDGKGGIDRVDYQSSIAPVIVNLGTGTAADGSGGTDTLLGIEDARGSSFNDSLTGDAGANKLEGLSGDDTLDGGTGTDTLIGGAGNDVYIVDVIGDVVTEAAAAGTDTVQSGITYVLGANLENLTLIGAAAINGTGNTQANVLTGNAANNALNGGAGADSMAGGLGNDIYVVDNAGDLVSEAAAAGTDTVQTSISYVLGAELENLTLIGAAAINGSGNALNNVITGNGADNVLDGGAGADRLTGGQGNDTLTGGTGADTFSFNAALNGTTNVDTLTDFATGVDHFALSRVIFSAISDPSLATGDFFQAGPVALDAGDRILYDQTSGVLSYDADGTGATAAIQVAIVGSAVHPAMAFTDFLLV